MTVFGATGHQDVPADAADFVTKAARRVLQHGKEPPHVVTSLAAGADQLIASLVVEGGGELDVVVPSQGYEATFSSPTARRAFTSLLRQAKTVTTLDFPQPSEEAFWAAGKMIVDRCDTLLAIWDGRPARGLGGTADVVRYAEERGREVCVIWPEGVER
jgi:hypothetical protein